MKFLWTTINVTNLDDTIAFYTEMIGLTVVNRFSPAPGVDIVFMSDGTENETLVEFIQNDHIPASNRGTVSIGFAVDSAETQYALLKEKGITMKGEIIAIPGLKFFFIEDLNGLTVQFVERG